MKHRQLSGVWKTMVSAVLFVFLIMASSPALALIEDGSNAVDLLGQYDGTSAVDPQPYYTKGGENEGPNKLGFYFDSGQTKSPVGVEIDAVNHRLFVSDTGNNRVLVYNLTVDNVLDDKIPDYVLGKADFFGTNVGSSASLYFPQGLAYDSVNDRLFVASDGSSKVSVFDTTTIENGESPTGYLGGSSGTTQSRFKGPAGLAYDSNNERLFVADEDNHRVLVFDVAVVTNAENAAYVLGQADFTSATSATTQSGFNKPRGLAYDSANNRLYIAEYSNHRVVTHDVTPATIANGQNAEYVLGQADFTSSTSLLTQAGLYTPQGVTFDSSNNRLFVSQTTGNRVTVFDVAAITNGEAATQVIGQSVFTSSIGSTTQDSTREPAGIAYDSSNDYLYVVQASFAQRISLFDVAVITDGEQAVDLLGQYDGTSLTDPQPYYTKGQENDGPNKFGFNSPHRIALDAANDRLFVTDTLNSRILVYNLNSDHTFPDRIPDYVLGQSDFFSNSTDRTQSGLGWPSAITYDEQNNRLFVGDRLHNRVMVFDVTTITNGENAINVLGKSSFTSTENTVSSSVTKTVYGLTYDTTNEHLFVADSNNNRVLVFDVSEITDGENAINVLGQADFTSSSSAVTQSRMYLPRGLTHDADNNRLFVADYGNARVLVYDTSTITDGENAINVIGQADFTSNTRAVTQSGLYYAEDVAYDSLNDRLFVSDSWTASSRVTVYDTSTITDGENAINIIGKSSYTNTASGVTQSGFKQAYGLAVDTVSNRLFVTQAYDGHRVSVFDVGVSGYSVTETSGSTTATEGGATDTFTVVLNAAPEVGDVVFGVTSGSVADVTVSPSSLTFTSANWNTPQTVTVTAVEDGDARTETVTITVSVNDASSDDDFDALADQAVMATTVENDTPGITLTQSDGETLVSEAGESSDTYTVVLDSEPSADVTVSVSADDQITVDPASLTFTAGNWSTPQTVTITAVDDTDAEGGRHEGVVSHTVSSGDGDYDGIAVSDITATINDNDGGGVVYYGPQSGSAVEVIPVSCALTSPNGGEIWQAGSKQQVTWESVGIIITNINLYYKLGTEGNWTLIHAGTENDGVYSWTLPNTASQDVYLKAVCRDSGGGTAASDETDNAFTITGEVVENPVPEEEIPTSREEINKLLPPEYPVDSLVKLPDDGDPTTYTDTTVYYIGLDGKRHPFLNAKAFFSWYKDFSLVKEIDMETLASIPLGGPILARPGTYWIKIQSDPKTYYVEPGYKLRWIRDERTAVALGGDDWNQRIIDVEPTFFARFQKGESIFFNDLTTTWPEGSMVKPVGENKSFIVLDGKRRELRASGAKENFLQERFLQEGPTAPGWLNLPLGEEVTGFEDRLFSRMAI